MQTANALHRSGHDVSVQPIDPLLTLAGLDELDPLLQHRSRLGTMVLLSSTDALSFTRLRELLVETDGNLGAQLRKLEEANYIVVKKQFVQRKPISWYSLSAAGRRALKRHLDALHAVLLANRAEE